MLSVPKRPQTHQEISARGDLSYAFLYILAAVIQGLLAVSAYF